jgi:hypothetical protein
MRKTTKSPGEKIVKDIKRAFAADVFIREPVVSAGDVLLQGYPPKIGHLRKLRFVVC